MNTYMIKRGLLSRLMQSKELLSNINVRKGHYLLDYTIARYLWESILIGDSIYVIVNENKYLGIEPLLRKLLEITMTLFYIINNQDSDRLAAKILVWDILNAEKEVDLKPTIFDQNQEKKEKFDSSIAIDVVKEALNEMEENGDVVLEIYQEAINKDRRYWHWSGTGPGAMVYKFIDEELDMHETVKQVNLELYKHLWSRLSSKTHASARWENPNLIFDSEEGLQFNDPLEKNEEKSAAFAGLATQLIKNCIRYVKEFYNIE